MLTLKMITEETDRVIRGLEKKHFKGAKESIAKVIELNDKRRSTQNQLDTNLAEVNSLSKTIGGLMKEGKKEEAEAAKKRVAEIKELSKGISKQGEDAKVVIRNIRRDAMDKFKAMKKSGELTEDDLKAIEKETQDLTDKYCKQIDEMAAAKSKEILEI